MLLLKKSAVVGVRFHSNSVLRVIAVRLMPDFAPASQPCAAAVEAALSKATTMRAFRAVEGGIIDRDETAGLPATAGCLRVGRGLRASRLRKTAARGMSRTVS